jgi:hypothetical protein
MAVTTVYAVVTDVMFMTELNRLLAFDPLPGVPRGTIDLHRDPKSSEQNKDSSKNAQLCQSVGAVMEDLWHAAAWLSLTQDSLNGRS